MPALPVLPPNAFQTWVRVGAFALLYGLLTEVCVRFFSFNGSVSVVWLPAGLALVAVLVGGPRFLAGMIAGDAVAISLRGEPLGMALQIALGNAAAAWLGAWLLQGLPRFDKLLPSVRDYLSLLGLGGVTGSLFSALVGVTSLWIYGRIDIAAMWPTLLSWWAGDAIGVLLLAPLLLIWRAKPPSWSGAGNSARRRLEVFLMLAFAFLLGQIVFAGWFNDRQGLVAQSYWLFVLLALYTPRMGRHGIALILVMFASQGLAAALYGTGLFAGDVASTRLSNFWLYLGTLGVFGMVSASYFEQLRHVQTELAMQEAAYRSQFADNSAVLVLFELDGRVIDANDAALRFYGHSREAMLATNLYQISQRTSAEVRDSLQSTSSSAGGRFESRHALADGTVRDVVVSLSPVRMGDRFAMHCIIFDITDQKRAEAEIETLAFYDPLTRLPNRRLLLDRLQQALANSVRSGRKGALLFIDLDHFKTLNDAHGHEKGDMLLQQTGGRLKDCVRTGDTVARLGGDEFVIMLKDLQPLENAAATQVKVVAAKVLAALKQPYRLDNIEHHGSGSVGIALFGAHNDTVEELFKRADMALYEAKGMGRNAMRFFDPAMQATMTERAALESDLRRALQAGQFMLHYQPQVNAEGRFTGAEALVRWQHPTRGLVPPAEFIAVAESTGLIMPLGQWVLETACNRLADWAQSPKTAYLTVSVNVSARQFNQTDFVHDVLATLQRTGAPAHRLRMELTESMLVQDIDDIIAKMTRLKALGVGFSLDDFGTGYSSLSYLKLLPLDQLKIDQAFVRDLLTDPNDAAIAKTIVALGQSLGLAVMAEGVETAAQRDFLRGLGCMAYQGFYFGHPDTADVIERSVNTVPAPLGGDSRRIDLEL